MSYYNTDTQEISKSLPKNIKTAKGFIGNPTEQQLIDAGWLMAEIVPFVVPDGYVKIAGTRTITIADSVPSEHWDVETQQTAHDREVAEQRTIEENMDIFKIIFRMCNLHRPENMKITVEEAKAIVADVIK